MDQELSPQPMTEDVEQVDLPVNIGPAEEPFSLSADQWAVAEALARNNDFCRIVLSAARRSGAEDTEGVLQETLIRAAKAADKIDLEKPNTWGFVVAHRITLDSLKKYISRYTVSVEPEVINFITDRPVSDIGEVVVNNVLLQTILPKLKPEQSKLLRLRYLEGWEVNELAELYGVEPSTMKGKMQSAIRSAHRIYETLLGD